MAGTLSDKAESREAQRLLLELHGEAQYALLIGSLLVLAVTGLPQKFETLAVSRWLMDAAGGIETLRLIHHLAGGVLIFAGLYHFALVLTAVLALNVLSPLRMIPDARDFRDAVRSVRHFLGLGPERTAFEGPSYFQKFDYWLIVWSLTVMGGTGFMALFPVRAARLVSGEAVLAVLRVHSDAAIFVLAWVLVVHVIYARLAPGLFHDRAAILSGGPSLTAPTVSRPVGPARDAAPVSPGGDPHSRQSGHREGGDVGAHQQEEGASRGDMELRR